MKLSIISFFFLICTSIFADTTSVTIFENNFIHFGGSEQNDNNYYTELDNGRILSTKIVLPEFNNPVKIIAVLDVDSDGDPWDRAGNIYLEFPEQANIEILKFITGFGGHSILENDVSFLAPMLKDTITVNAFVDTWVQRGWIINFSLKIIETDTLSSSSWNFATLFNTGLTREQIDQKKPKSQINIPPSQERILLTYYVSGHCTDGEGADEFVTKDNVISIDGNEVLRYQPWRDDCINFRDQNPSSGRWGDVWSSDLDRSGWCPGDKVYPVILDVTDKLNTGVHDITYWIENIRRKDIDGDYGYWRVSSFLTGWGDISNWLPTKIILSGPTENSYPTDAIIDLQIDLVDGAGYTVFKTDEKVEISADSSNALFSLDKENWSNPLQFDISYGTSNVWFKSSVEGEITISAVDVDANPNMQASDKLTINIEKSKVLEGNYALLFDGADDLLNCGNDSSLQITGSQITLEAWIYASEWASEVWQGCVINKEQNGSGLDNGYMLRCGKNGTLNFNLGNGSWNEINSAAGAMKTNRWYHIAGTYDGNVMKSYINGNAVGSKFKVLSINDAKDIDLVVGDSKSNPGRVFNGMIDEVRIWNVARSAEQISANMYDTLSSNYYESADSGLVGYWRLNENSGQFSNDLSVYSNNARLGSSSDVDDSDPSWVESGSFVGIKDNYKTIPDDFTVMQNYPNPFNSETRVRFFTPKVAKVHATIFNSNGELVTHLINGQFPKGEHSVVWNGKKVASGVYFLRFRFTDSSGKNVFKSMKMINLK